jgi:hypothetical protein
MVVGISSTPQKSANRFAKQVGCTGRFSPHSKWMFFASQVSLSPVHFNLSAIRSQAAGTGKMMWRIQFYPPLVVTASLDRMLWCLT